MTLQGVVARADRARGFYGPGTRTWRINREAVLLAAGPAALLLQVAHPLVAEGVAQHSEFEADPFGRLRRTLATTMDIVFGDAATAERAVSRLNRVHAGVRGEVTDREARILTGAAAYRALDPELLLWVQATLVVTSVHAYERWVGRLTAEDREAFWAEARRVGTAMGIPLSVSPPDWASLERYWDGMLGAGGPVRVTPTARMLAPRIVRPPLPIVPGWAVTLAALPGLSLLPHRIRAEYGIAWGTRRERLAGWLGRGVRLWIRVTPHAWRAMPQARAAEARVSRSRRDPARSAADSATIPRTHNREPSHRA
jgi:uncharacterized protein (DUF2236 family)